MRVLRAGGALALAALFAQSLLGFGDAALDEFFAAYVYNGVTLARRRAVRRCAPRSCAATGWRGRASAPG